MLVLPKNLILQWVLIFVSSFFVQQTSAVSVMKKAINNEIHDIGKNEEQSSANNKDEKTTNDETILVSVDDDAGIDNQVVTNVTFAEQGNGADAAVGVSKTEQNQKTDQKSGVSTSLSTNGGDGAKPCGDDGKCTYWEVKGIDPEGNKKPWKWGPHVIINKDNKKFKIGKDSPEAGTITKEDN